MDLLTERHIFLIAVFIYGLSAAYSAFLWRKGFRRDDRVNAILLFTALGLHTVAMVMRGFSFKTCPVNNLYEATIFAGWAFALAALLVSLLPRLRFITAFAAPVLFGLGVFALMPALDPPHGPKPQFTGSLVSLHAATILLAYGTFGLAAVAGLMFLTQQHDLKFKKLGAVISLLPSIERLETLITRLVLIGWLLLTVGLFLGGQLPRPEGVAYLGDAKVKWSALLWFSYLTMLFAHRRLGFVGKRYAYGAVAAFAFLMLTFWGTNLLSRLHQP